MGLLVGTSAWTVQDDDGTGQFGDVWDAAWVAAAAASIDAVLQSATNPTVTPAALIDEVVAARGSKLTLDARLDVALNEDGTPKAVAGQASLADVGTQVGAKNLAHDSLLMLWPDGDTAAPSGWTLSGTGAAIVRTGTGGAGYEAATPADATKMKFGHFAMKVTRGSTDAKVTKTFIPATAFPLGLRGRKVSIVVRAVSAVVAQCSIIADDGVTTTRGGTTGNGTWHTGGGAEEMLYLTHTFSATATKLDLQLEVAGSGAAYFGDICIVISDVVPADYFPERWGYFVVGQQQRGTATVANLINEFRHDLEFPAYFYKTRLKAKTAPTGASIIARPAKTSATYPYATPPSIAIGATAGNRVVDGTYANRCFKQGDIFVWDITQVGSGTVGEEVNATFVFIVSLPELDLLGF